MADLVSFEEVTKVYEGAVPTTAVDEVSFKINGGEFCALVGQSGSGKSTLLNLVGLLDHPTSGRILLSGKDTSKQNKRTRASLRNSNIGFIFQFHHLLPEFNVIENMLMPARISGNGVDDTIRTRARDLLGLLGLDGTEKKLGDQLSGGQKQRVAIGRALINQPSLVLADEPTGNLDTANSNQVYELFRKINDELGTAFLIVTHDRGIAQRTDRILEIEDGRLVQDTHAAGLKVDA